MPQTPHNEVGEWTSNYIPLDNNEIQLLYPSSNLKENVLLPTGPFVKVILVNAHINRLE